MNKKQLLHHLKNNVYCKLQQSKIEGVGVFAIRDIPKGTDPLVGSFRENYVAFTPDEFKDLPDGVKKMIEEYLTVIDGTILVPSCGMNRLDISFFLNHSETPNVEVDLDTDKCVALRDINVGEELTINYKEYCGEDPSKLK